MNPVDTAIVKLSLESLESCQTALSQETKDSLYREFKEALILRLQDKGRHHKVKKDPAQPKRGKSGYLFYCDEHRERVRNENKDSDGNPLSVSEAAKILGKHWNELSDANKAPYLKMAEDAKAQYNKAMEEYNSKSPAEQLST